MSFVTIQVRDKREFKIELKIARMSKTIASMIENQQENDPKSEPFVPLTNIPGETFEKIIEWAKQHVNDTPEEVVDDYHYREPCSRDIEDWDKRFFKEFEVGKLLGTLAIANFLNMQELMAVVGKTIANLIKDSNSLEDTRELFGIVNDFTEEELKNLPDLWGQEYDLGPTNDVHSFVIDEK